MGKPWRTLTLQLPDFAYPHLAMQCTYPADSVVGLPELFASISNVKPKIERPLTECQKIARPA